MTILDEQRPYTWYLSKNYPLSLLPCVDCPLRSSTLSFTVYVSLYLWFCPFGKSQTTSPGSYKVFPLHSLLFNLCLHSLHSYSTSGVYYNTLSGVVGHCLWIMASSFFPTQQICMLLEDSPGSDYAGIPMHSLPKLLLHSWYVIRHIGELNGKAGCHFWFLGFGVWLII